MFCKDVKLEREEFRKFNRACHLRLLKMKAFKIDII